MADWCFHGSPIENCADCLIERLTRERDDAWAEADRLREHLRTAEGWQAEANNLRAMLREWWESVDECPFCGRWKTGHAPDCRLAAELKEGRDE